MYIMQNPIYWKIRDRCNLRLNSNMEVVNNLKTIPGCTQFKTHDHDFMKHVKFTLIKQAKHQMQAKAPKDYS